MKDRLLISFFLVVLVLFRFSHESVSCNLNLLATFKLKGIRKSVNDQMMVCPNVYNRCCNLMDEVRIVQLWNIYGQQQVRIFANSMTNLYKQFYKIHPFFERITTSDMVFHYLSFNAMRTLRRVCNENTRILDLRRWGKFLEMQRMFPGVGPVRRIGSQNRFQNLVRIIKRLIINDADDIDGDTRFTRHLEDITVPKVNGISTRKHREIFKEMLGSPLKRFLKIQGEFKKASAEFEKKTAKSDRMLEHLPKKLQRKVKQTKNKEVKAKAQSKINRQLRTITIFVPRGNTFLNRFQFFTRMRVPFIPVNTEIPVIQCRTRFSRVMKPFLVLNEDKFHFCQLMIEKIKKVDVNFAISGLETTKAMLTNMLELKKSIYCTICDAANQQLFDVNRGMIVYSQEFCFDILTRYKDYIFFKNIEFVQYIDDLMQVQECTQSTGDENTFPSVNRVSWMKRRIPFIQRCYENLDKPDYYIYCRFMCVQYRLQDYSKFFEGDMKLLSELFSGMASFLRSIRSTRTYTSEDFDILRVPDNQSRRNATHTGFNTTFHEEEANLDITEQQIQPHMDNKTEYDFSEQYISGEIFERIQQPIEIENFRSFFASNLVGINPIRAYSLIDFRIKIDDILAEQSKRTTRENLQVSALEGYFDAKNSMIDEFNRDVDLEFNEVIQDETDIQNQIERDKKKSKGKKPTKIVNPGLVEKEPDQIENPNVPDWNQQFSSEGKNEPDKVSSWFNYFFHSK